MAPRPCPPRLDVAVTASPSGAPGCQGQAPPCVTLTALKALDGGYAKQEAYW